MPVKYINYSDHGKDEYKLHLPNDFTSSHNDKYIVIKKVRLINSNGQLDVGCCLCGDFADESSYSYGLMDDFIICSNEINEKEIHIHDNNMRFIKFYFRDYKGIKITAADDYYFSLEIKLIY